MTHKLKIVDNIYNNKAYLFRQLLLTQFVQCEELFRQYNILQETTTGQLDSDDDSPVRHHHGYSAEVDLQILGQLLTPGVAGILTKRWRGMKLKGTSTSHIMNCSTQNL